MREDARRPGFGRSLLLAVWAAVIFGFFSLSGSKLPGYIVPVFPALAILAAVALDRLDPAQWRRHVLVAAVLVVAGLLPCRFFPAKAVTRSCASAFNAYRRHRWPSVLALDPVRPGGSASGWAAAVSGEASRSTP